MIIFAEDAVAHIKWTATGVQLNVAYSGTRGPARSFLWTAIASAAISVSQQGSRLATTAEISPLFDGVIFQASPTTSSGAWIQATVADTRPVVQSRRA